TMTDLGVMELDVTQIEPRQENRAVGGYDEIELAELAESIKAQGLLHPIVVRKLPSRGKGYQDIFQIIAGERRWRAVQIAGQETIKVSARECSDEEALEVAGVENIQRADLHPLDEADEIVRLLGMW